VTAPGAFPSLVAIGGNAIRPSDIRGAPREQVEPAARIGESP